MLLPINAAGFSVYNLKFFFHRQRHKCTVIDTNFACLPATPAQRLTGVKEMENIRSLSLLWVFAQAGKQNFCHLLACTRYVLTFMRTSNHYWEVSMPTAISSCQQCRQLISHQWPQWSTMSNVVSNFFNLTSNRVIDALWCFYRFILHKIYCVLLGFDLTKKQLFFFFYSSAEGKSLRTRTGLSIKVLSWWVYFPRVKFLFVKKQKIWNEKITSILKCLMDYEFNVYKV